MAVCHRCRREEYLTPRIASSLSEVIFVHCLIVGIMLPFCSSLILDNADRRTAFASLLSALCHGLRLVSGHPTQTVKPPQVAWTRRNPARMIWSLPSLQGLVSCHTTLFGFLHTGTPARRSSTMSKEEARWPSSPDAVDFDGCFKVLPCRESHRWPTRRRTFADLSSAECHPPLMSCSWCQLSKVSVCQCSASKSACRWRLEPDAPREDEKLATDLCLGDGTIRALRSIVKCKPLMCLTIR